MERRSGKGGGLDEQVPVRQVFSTIVARSRYFASQKVQHCELSGPGELRSKHQIGTE